MATFHQLFRVDLSVPRFVELAEEVLPKGRAARFMAREEKLNYKWPIFFGGKMNHL